VLYENNRAITISSRTETEIFSSIELFHKDNLKIKYDARGQNNGHSITFSIYTQSWDIEGNMISEDLAFTNMYSNNSIGNIRSIDLPENCHRYKIIAKARKNNNKDGSVSNISITANTALPENLELDYRGEKSVTVKWDTELPDQRQRFNVELLNGSGASFNPKVIIENTEANSATLEFPHLRPQGYLVRVSSLGDGINSNTIMGSSQAELLTYTTSLFCLPSESATVELKGGTGRYYASLLNASGKVVKTFTETVSTSTTKTIKFDRDGSQETETILDNEYRILVAAADLNSTLSADPERIPGNQVYKNEGYLAQLVSDIKGVYNDKFELAETMEDGTVRLASTIQTIIYENETVEFNLTPQTKHIDLRTDELAAEGGYQAVIRFQTRKSEDKNNPKLQFFVADMNNNIITSIAAPTIIVNNLSFDDKVATLTIPSTVTGPHRIIIRCSVEKGNPHNTCYVKDLRITRHDNIATNLQLSSCTDSLKISWDIASTDEAITNCYAVQLLDETGTYFIAQSDETKGNSASISLDDDNIISGTYKLRVMTFTEDGAPLGISAMRSFTYIKSGDSFNIETTTKIDFLLLGLEDDGNVGALNKVAQMTTTNTQLDVTKVALQMKITSGQYYFVSFPFQPDSMYVDCAKALQGENIVIRGFDSEKYSVTPGNSNNFYPILGDGTTNIPFNSLEIGKGYLMSINTRATNNVKAEVFVTIIANLSAQESRYVNYNLMELDMQGESVIEDGSGNGYGYKGWSLLANPFPRTFGLENNFYVSVYKLPSLSSTGSNDDGKVAAAGYSVYRNTPGDVIPAFVPFFVQSDAATFAMKPNTIASSTANDLSQELRLNLSDGNSFDEVILNLDEEASQFYTIGKDLIKMSSMASGVPQISSRVGSETLVVRALTPEMALEGIPVELYAGKSGKQSLSIANSEWDGEYEYFVRNANGEEFILNDGAYEFDGVAGKTTKITFFARTMPLSVEDEIAQKVTVSQLGDAIEISAPEMIQNVKLFNLNGSLVKSSTPMSERSTINSVETGVYIVEIIMATSREVVKVVIQ